MADEYWLIGGDGKEYGPVTLATLTQWIQERRVVAASRVRRGAGPFMEAGRLPEIAGLFPSQTGTWLPPTPGAPTEVVAPTVAVQLPAEFRVWQLFGLAWTLVKRSWLPLGAMFFIMALVMVVPILGCLLLFVLGGPILVGVWRAILGMIGGRSPTVGMMFEGFDRFGDAFLAFLVSSILFAIGGILIVPAIILGLMWSFTFMVLGETRAGFWEAMHASAVLTEGYRWRLFLLGLAAIPILILGLCVFVVGVFVAQAVVFTAWALAYRFIQQHKAQAAKAA